MNSIKKYYDELAPSYDSNRFANTYGKYIDKQERKIMESWSLPLHKDSNILDLACGTGRFLDFANHGSDISQEMIKQATLKYPNLKLVAADAQELPFSAKNFNQIHSFHLFMHLSKSNFFEIKKEMERVLKKNGIFIFDVPSKKRRSLLGYQKSDWHGGTSYSVAELKTIFGNNWKMISTQGILFFPIHRIPKRFRSYFLALDSWLCRSFLKEYASYIVIKMKLK